MFLSKSPKATGRLRREPRLGHVGARATLCVLIGWTHGARRLTLQRSQSASADRAEPRLQPREGEELNDIFIAVAEGDRTAAEGIVVRATSRFASKPGQSRGFSRRAEWRLQSPSDVACGDLEERNMSPARARG